MKKKQGNMTPPIGHNNSLEIGKKCARNKKKMPEKQFKRRHTNMDKE